MFLFPLFLLIALMKRQACINHNVASQGKGARIAYTILRSKSVQNTMLSCWALAPAVAHRRQLKEDIMYKQYDNAISIPG